MRWRIPWIWIVPLAAVLLAGYLVYNRVRELGPTITIHFRDAEGLKPGQTPIQYRGVSIGEVSEVTLSEDHQSAAVEVNLRRMAAAVAREGSTFWIVRPQLGMGDFTGLGTLISGPHITVAPGNGKPASEFTGAKFSADIIDPEGLNVVLLSAHAGSLRTGIPVYYRGVEVGAVRETQLSTNARTVEIHAVIERRFAPLVHSDSKFWNVTGLDVRFGLLRGAEINVESLKSLIIGGIAFATPTETEGGPIADGTYFRLYDQREKEWLEWSPEIAIQPASSNAPAKKETPASSSYLSDERSPR